MLFHLEVVQGTYLGRVFTFQDKKEIVVGRSDKADLVLKDERISRGHCKFVITQGGVYVCDLKSRNGIFHRNKSNKVEKALLVSGDLVYLGMKNALRFHLERSAGDVNYFCESCGKAILLPTYASGEVAEIRGRLLCPECSPQLDIPPQTIPGYQILTKVGEGAMGSVYKSLRLQDKSCVALKILKFEDQPDEKVMARFQREAMTEGAMDHPNIVKLYDFGVSPPCYFIALEYIEGATILDIIIEHGPLEPHMVLNVAIKVARALDHAYERRVVHRDVKPSNIMISHQGEIKLADFGLAKNFDDAGLSMLTTSGTGIGTPAYMAPEQITDARFVDQRADIYSLGVTLYVALTGYRPFNAKSTHEYLKLILSAQPMPLLNLRPDAPPRLTQIIEKAMAKAPEKRYQTPGEMLRDLVEYAKEMAK